MVAIAVADCVCIVVKMNEITRSQLQIQRNEYTTEMCIAAIKLQNNVKPIGHSLRWSAIFLHCQWNCYSNNSIFPCDSLNWSSSGWSLKCSQDPIYSLIIVITKRNEEYGSRRQWHAQHNIDQMQFGLNGNQWSLDRCIDGDWVCEWDGKKLP